MTADIITTWLPSFCIVQPATPEGEDWLIDNVPSLGLEGAVEHRYLADIVYAALDDGLAVQDTATGNFAERN